MKISKKDMLLYAVTDRAGDSEASLYKKTEEAIQGGATFIQLREKHLDTETFLREAVTLKKICSKYNVPFVINDDVDIAVKSGADGVHVGQDDMDIKEVRKKLGEDKIIGVSAHNVEEALLAEKNGADYLGVGAAFHTGTKGDAHVIEHSVYKDICSSVKIPVVAIGGINRDNIKNLSESGISGAAVVSAIFAQDDPKTAAHELKNIISEMVE